MTFLNKNLRKEYPIDAIHDAPVVESQLRHNILKIPVETYACSGIVIYGRLIKTLVFTTDIAIIRNCDADAVFAVYPFTPQQAISDAIIKSSYIPVFCGVGGGTTKGIRTVSLAKDVESQGAMGVVLNAPITNVNLAAVSVAVDIPVIITVVNDTTDIGARLAAGASILNVAAGINTPEVVRKIRADYPDVPIIATGGNVPESITRTIEAGANAITYTPPSTNELFKTMMKKYRDD
jgi:2-keto-3-deoxy-6-phosphogluconate aldolase